MQDSLIKAFISPSNYIQGPDLLNKLPNYVSKFGKNCLILMFDLGFKLFADSIADSFKGTGMKMEMTEFCGECCREEIDRVKEILHNRGFTTIVAIGSGKTIDCAKAVAFTSENIHCIVCPTTCSTDAPTSALSVVYDGKTHAFDQYMFHGRNPHMVIVDTKVIVNAPARFLVSGEGDALATYFEARACMRKGSAVAMSGGASTLTAFGLSELCYKTLLADGLKAKIACENKVITKAFENICEANTLLSGLGFESSGLAAAHAVHNGLTIIKSVHDTKFHGEIVAFGTITQLVLENAPMEEIETVINFCKSVGLPICFSDLGMTSNDHELLREVSVKACQEGDTMSNMPFPVSADDVYAALISADAIGRSMK